MPGTISGANLSALSCAGTFSSRHGARRVRLCVVIASALVLGACSDPTGPESAGALNGTWSGSVGGQTLQLTLTYVKTTASAYGPPVEVHLLNYAGAFFDVTLGYTGVVQGQYKFSFAHELRPFTLSDIGYFSSTNGVYTFFFRGQQTGAHEISGWLFREGPYSTGRVIDSVAFTLRRT